MLVKFGFAWNGGIRNVLLCVTFFGKGRRRLRKRGVSQLPEEKGMFVIPKLFLFHVFKKVD